MPINCLPIGVEPEANETQVVAVPLTQGALCHTIIAELDTDLRNAIFAVSAVPDPETPVRALQHTRRADAMTDGRG